MFWLGDCLEQLYGEGSVLHGYNSEYVVAGERASLRVEAGHPPDLPVIERQLDGLLAGGLPPLEYLFTTQQETPHAAASDALLNRYPRSVACGTCATST